MSSANLHVMETTLKRGFGVHTFPHGKRFAFTISILGRVDRMGPSLLEHTLRGMLRSGDQQSTCDVTQRVAGQGPASYYTNAAILDSSVSPHLEDGDYEFHYLGEPDPRVPVTRQDCLWLKVPPSARTINRG